MTAETPAAPVPDLRPRDHLQRFRASALSPRERLAVMQRLIDEAWAVLERHPEGLAHFRRRNFRSRAVSRSRETLADGT
jgi:hypothetical protein